MKTGRIYRIVADDTNKTYIGSTIQSLKTRLIKHKSDFKRDKNCSSKIIMEYKNPKIILLEEINYENIIDLRNRERHYIELEKDICVNLKCLKSKIQQNKEKPEKMKLYRQINKEKLLETNRKYMTNYVAENYDKIHAPNDCICGGTFIHKHKSRHLKSKKHLAYENKNTTI